MIVLDASAAVELLLGTAAGEAVFERIGETSESIHAPHLLDVETVNALRRIAGSGRIAAERAGAALRDYQDLRITRYGHEIFLDRIWQLRDVASAYDAVYVALAEALDAPLLTCDARLARIRGHAAAVELF